MNETRGKPLTDLFPIPGIQQRAYSSTEVKSVFDQLDLDKNGFLEESDIRHMLLVTGQTATDEEVKEMIRMVDHDGSGIVSLDEFTMLCCEPGHVFQNPDIEKIRLSASVTPVQTAIVPKSEIPLEVADLISSRFSKIDFDDLGFLNYSQFLQLISKQDAPHLKRMFQFFAISEKLTVEDLLRGLPCLLTDSERRKFLFKILDTNDSGALEENELSNFSENILFIFDILYIPRGAPISEAKFLTLCDLAPELVLPNLQELEEIYILLST